MNRTPQNLKICCIFIFLIVSGIFFPLAAPAQEIQKLWDEAHPFTDVAEEELPVLAVWLPDQELATGTAIVILPGGGYSHLAIDHEGYQVAERLNRMGITAFVLNYRRGPDYPHPVPLRDAQRAIRTVRSQAVRWEIDPERVGILGFSAGGHLASSAGTHFDYGVPDTEDPVDRVSSRPDFMVLIYPVITMVEEFMHSGSRNNLIGNDPDPVLAERMSSERQVSADTPPAFLVHSSDDTVVPVENSIHFYQALQASGVPAEMHIYETGRHGFGLAPENPLLSTWPGLLENWLRHRGL